MKIINAYLPFENLSQIIINFSPEVTKEKIELLKKCAEVKLNATARIKHYHNQLLFLCTYPENEAIQLLAQEEMNRLCEAVISLNDQNKERLSKTGIAFTETQGTFSFAIMKWLATQFPEEISLHSFDDEGVHPKVIFKYCLNEMEFELIGDQGLSKLKWLQRASGTKNKQDNLKWMLSSIEELRLNPLLGEQLFESLKLYITINPLNPQFSRSFGTIGQKDPHYHSKGLLKKFNELELINRKLPPEKKLSSDQRESILKAARVSLVLLNRETDPITYGTADGIKVFDLEHGLSIALFSIKPQLRLPIESYIGFMMFKNGYPMSYGGGWLFGKRSLIGINIFEAFRGGESAFVFAQLLRTYKQAFGAEQFEVEPYQYGKNNPEGLQSGAFWFYHRFGFRPTDEELFKLAEEEYENKIKSKGYRSPIHILRQFTKSNLEVNFGKSKILIKPLQISYFISHLIALRFKGDRNLAFKWSQTILKAKLGLVYSKLNKEEQYGFIKLSVFAASCLNLEKLNASDKNTLIKLIKEKGSSEFNYIRTYNQFPFDKYFVNELLDFVVN